MIDHTYCINLERRKDRRARVQDEFDANGIENVEFFNGTDGKLYAPDDIRITKSEWGCSDSHIRIWRDMIEKGYKTVLVFEDDVRILPGFNERLNSIINELKNFESWDYINLGPLAWRDRGSKVSCNLTRGSAWGAHCYLVSEKGARKIAVWESKDLRYCQDVQIARSPLDMYYTPHPLANQESFDSSVLGVFKSMTTGDIGLSRTVDFDYIIRDSWQKSDWFLIALLICLIISLFRRV